MKTAILFRWAVAAWALLLGAPTFAQQLQGAHWFWGERVGIDFTRGAPRFEPGGQTGLPNTTDAFGMPSSVSDASGNLLFYGGNRLVWNRRHQLLPNSTDAHAAVTLTAPQTGSSSLYWMLEWDGTSFTTTGFRDYALRYQVIDATDADNPVVDPARRHVLVRRNISNAMTAATAPNSDTWVVTHTAVGDTFLVWRVTATGLAPAPVISRVGLVFDSASNPAHPLRYSDATECRLKMAINGRRLLLTNYQRGLWQLLDFDATTGRVTGVYAQDYIYPPGSNQLATMYGGGAFSPDGNRLYLATEEPFHPSAISYAARIYQYDLTQPASQLTATRQVVFSDPDRYMIRALQLGVDGRLYFLTDTTYQTTPYVANGQLNVINYPNRLGAACGVQLSVVRYPYRAAAPFPPALNETFFRNAGQLQIAAKPTATPCHGDTVELLAFGGGVSAFSWAPGHHLPAGASGPTVRVPADSVATYRVQGLSADDPPRLLVAQITLAPRPRPAPPTVTLTGGTLAATTGGVALGWQWLLNGQPLPGATGPTLVVAQGGTYQVVLTGPGGCTSPSAPLAVHLTATGAEVAAAGLRAWPVPVPAGEALRVLGPPHAAVRLLDALGRPVRAAALDAAGAGSLPTAGLAPGVYWLAAAALRQRVLVR